MYRYAQIEIETGTVISDSYLSGELDLPDMIPIPGDFDPMGKRYVNGGWEDYTPPTASPVDPGPTEQEQINAEILLNQATILSNQNATDAVLAEILLNQMGG